MASINIRSSSAWSSIGGGAGDETDPVAGPALTTHAALTTTAHGGLLASTTKPSDIGEFFDQRRSSEVSTLPRIICSPVATALASGTCSATLAIARTAGTFTKIRFAVGTQPAVSVTAARVGVWASDGTLVTDADIASLITTGATLRDNVALGGSVVVTAGQTLYLGFGVVASTMPQMLGISGLGVTKVLSPTLGKTQTGYSSGTLPTLTGTSPSTNVWLELIP